MRNLFLLPWWFLLLFFRLPVSIYTGIHLMNTYWYVLILSKALDQFVMMIIFKNLYILNPKNERQNSLNL